MRILHLIDPGSPGGGGCTLHMLAEATQRITSAEHQCLVIGTKNHVRLARECGVEVIGCLNPPLNAPLMARRSLQRVVEMYETAGGKYDVVHCWTQRTATLAMNALPRHLKMATFSIGPVSGVAMELFLREVRHHALPVLTNSTGVMMEYESAGVPSELMSVLAPGVNPSSVDMTPRAELRNRWGVGEDEFVVGLLSEPVSWADVRAAAEIAGRVASTERPLRLVVHHAAHQRAEGEQWARNLHEHDMIIVDDAVAEPWTVANGFDCALLIGGDMNVQDLSDMSSPNAFLVGGGRRMRPMPGVMPLLWAMAAGVPVISEAGDAVRDILEEGRTGLHVRPGDLNTAAERVARLYDDRSIGRRIGAAAAETVRNRFHISRYCVRLKQAYEAVLDQRSPHEIEEAEDELWRDDAPQLRIQTAVAL